MVRARRSVAFRAIVLVPVATVAQGRLLFLEGLTTLREINKVTFVE